MEKYRYAGVNSDDSEEEDLVNYQGGTDKEIISRLSGEILKCRVDLEECKESKLSNKFKKLVSCRSAGLKKKPRRKKNTKKKTKYKKKKMTKKRKHTRKRT